MNITDEMIEEILRALGGLLLLAAIMCTVLFFIGRGK